jgi:cysteine desulfurase
MHNSDGPKTMSDRYFDHAATTPLDARVLEEMMPYLTSEFGNAHSLHGFGQRAASAVELARTRVAALVGADYPEQIIFTSGATEACNWVIRNFEKGYISPFEHNAVREPALRQGYKVVWEEWNPDNDTPQTLACQMMVNNETGMCWNPGGHVGAWGDCILTDATQALGKIPVNLTSIGFAAFSAHKLYGPKGIGGLYNGDAVTENLLLGGEQEWGLRAGTLNVPGIVGFGAACAIAEQEMVADYASAAKQRGIVLEELSACSDWQVNEGHSEFKSGENFYRAAEAQVPHILSISFLGLQGETIVIEADQAGFAISSGAACSSHSTEPSHVLTAMGLPDEWLRGTIRISFGRTNTSESSAELGRNLATIVNKLRNLTN